MQAFLRFLLLLDVYILQCRAEAAGGDAAPLEASTLNGIHGKADANKDGKMSLDEVLDFAAGMRKTIAAKDMTMVLDAMDTDKSKTLSLEELLEGVYGANRPDSASDGPDEVPQQKALEAKKFKAADTDGDGQLDLGELSGMFYPETNEAVLDVVVADHIHTKDKDGDGVLSVREFWDVPDGQQVSDSDQKDFAKFDTDAGGTLSFAEIKEWESGRLQMGHSMKELFKVADKDGDMHVTVDELGRASGDIVGTDAHYHMMEWAEHGSDESEL